MPCRIIAVPATSSTTPTARNSCRSSRRPVSLAPTIAPGTDVTAPTPSNVQSTPPGRWPNTPGDAQAKTDGGVGAHSAEWFGADEAEQRRKPQCAEDESDESAEHPDQRSRQDRCPCAETSRIRPPPVRLRANEIDPEGEKRHADDHQQCVSWNRGGQESAGHRPDHGRGRHPREQAPVDPTCPDVCRGGCEGRDGRDTDVRAGTRRGAGGRQNEHREPNVPKHEAHETARKRGHEAPEPDCDEEESVQALEYPA